MIQQYRLTSEQVNSQVVGDRELAENICQEVRDQSPQGINYNVLVM